MESQKSKWYKTETVLSKVSQASLKKKKKRESSYRISYFRFPQKTLSQGFELKQFVRRYKEWRQVREKIDIKNEGNQS